MSCLWVSCLAHDGHAVGTRLYIQMQENTGRYLRKRTVFKRYWQVKCWSIWTELAVSCVWVSEWVSECVCVWFAWTRYIVYCQIDELPFDNYWWLSPHVFLWLGSRIDNVSDYLAVGAEWGSRSCSFNWFGGSARSQCPREERDSEAPNFVWFTRLHSNDTMQYQDIGIWWLSKCYKYIYIFVSYAKSILWSKSSIPALDSSSSSTS